MRSSLGVGLVLLGLVAGCDSEAREPPAPRAGAAGGAASPCPVGTERASPGAPAGRRSVVLACGRTRDGTAVQLSSFRDAAGPCVVITGLPGGARACGRAPSERVPSVRDAIGGGVIVRRSPGARLELYGETAPHVRRVRLRYRRADGRPSRRPAALIPVTDGAALRAARIREPFGYFIGAVPARAERVAAEALDGSGAVVGRLGFDPIVRSQPPTVFLASRE